MAKIPVYDAIRIIPRDIDFLNRKVGNRGEIFYDKQTNTLILFNGDTVGGTSLAKSDLSNIANSTFLAKATAAGVSSSGTSNVTVSVSNTVPSSPTNGNLWLNTETGILYVYINDGDSNQWIQPAVPTVDLTGYATEDYVDNAVANISNLNLANVATTGSYSDLTNKPTSFTNLTSLSLAIGPIIDEFSTDSTLAGNSNTAVPTELAVKTYVDTAVSAIDVGSVSISSLTDVQVSSPITVGHVLKWNGTNWAPAVDATVGGAGTDADTLNGQNGSYYLNYDNLSGRPDLTVYATKSNPEFSGTVTGISKSMVGLGNVDNTADIDKVVASATTATNSTNINLTASAANSAFYLPFFSGNSNGNKALAFDSDLQYNPSTNVLSIGSGTGTISANLSGNATTATTAGALNTINTYQIGGLGVGTAASATTGEIRATNNITAYFSSDIKFKENIQNVESALDKVCAIGSKTFDWTDEYIAARGGDDGYFVRKSDFGVIAQDVLKVFPQAVRTRSDGSLAVDYEKLATLSFGAIIELTAELNSIKKHLGI